MKKLYIKFWITRLRRGRWVRKHRTSVSIGLIVSLFGAGLSIFGWTTNQTIDNLRINFICSQIPDVSGNMVYTTIEFANEGLPIQLSWTIDAITNISSISGSLVGTIPTGNSVQRMIFVVNGWYSNSTVYQVYSLAKYSGFPEPRVFSQTLPASYSIHGYRLLSDVAQFLPPTMAFLFYAQEGNRPTAVCL